MNTKIEDLPSIKPELEDIFINYGSDTLYNISNLIPIKNSEQSAISGSEENISKTNYVGHVCYSKDFSCFIYQMERERKHFLQSIPGKGLAISKKIIENLKNEYNVQYVFTGIRETNDILIIPIEKFFNEWETDGWDKQLYAIVAEDVEYEIPDEMSTIFTDIPMETNKSISYSEAIEKYT